MTSGQEHRRQQQRMDSRQPDLASRIVSTALENFAATSAAHNASSSSPSSSNVVDVDHNSLRRYADIVAAENADVLTLQSQLVLALHALDQMSSEQAQLLDQLRQELDLMSSSSQRQNISHQQQAQDPNEVDAAAGNDAAVMEEAEQSNLYAATLQIDLIRTRERMNDALSFAKTSARGRTRRRRRRRRRRSRRSRRTGLSGSFSIAEEVVGAEEVVEFEGQLNDLPADGDTFNATNRNETNIRDTQTNIIMEENGMLRATIASLTFDLTRVREQLNDERSVRHNRRRSSSSSYGRATKRRGSMPSCHSRDEIEEYDIVAAAPPAEDMATATAAATTATATAAAAAAAATAAAVRPPTPDAATSTAEEAPTTPPAAKEAADATPAAVDDKLESEVQQQQQQQQQRPKLSRRASRRNSFVGSAA